MASINSTMLAAAKWIGTGAGVSGAILIALNLGIVAQGFALPGIIPTAVLHRTDPARADLEVLQSVFTGANVLGLWRWA